MGYALITGASSGLGRDLAQLFAADGHDVVLIARRSIRLQELARDIERRFGVRARPMAIDLRDADAFPFIERAIADLEISYLVNNAGFGLIGNFATTPLDDEVGMIMLHILAATRLTKLLLPSMLRRDSGRILNIASIAAFLPGPFASVYYATKAYLLSWSEALAEELRYSKVTVTAACPGRTATEFASTASIPSARLLATPTQSMRVARQAYRAMHTGQRIVIYGLANKAIPYFVRLAPREVITKVTRLIQGRG